MVLTAVHVWYNAVTATKKVAGRSLVGFKPSNTLKLWIESSIQACLDKTESEAGPPGITDWESMRIYQP